MNSAQISYYFGGKEGLYQAVLEAQFAPIGELLEKARRIPQGEGLRLYTQEIVAVHQRSPYLLRLMTSELASDYKRVLENLLVSLFCREKQCFGEYWNGVFFYQSSYYLLF